MAANSKIDWLAPQPDQNISPGHTVNLWWGCSKEHTGCKNCYAQSLSNRFGNDIWGEDKPRKMIKSAFKDLDKYQRQAAKSNTRAKVFVGSMMDIFEEPKILRKIHSKNGITEYHLTSDLRIQLFKRIENGLYPNLIFLFLTKRPGNIFLSIPFEWADNPPLNVWMGTSISNQETVEYAEILKQNWNGKMFLSIEPHIGLIDELNLSGIDWVIQGGESGPGKRPFDLQWAYDMKKFCIGWRVPYFFKQIDKVKPIPDDLNVRQFPKF